MRTLTVLIVFVTLLGGCSADSDLVSFDQDAAPQASTALAPLTEGSGAAAKASSTTERDVVMLDITVPSACLDEMVHVEGPVDVRIHTTVDGRGVMHQMGSYRWKEVTATGVESGNTWHTSAGLELYTVLNYELEEPFQPVPTPTRLGEPAVFHHTGAIRFISDDGGPDLYVRHVLQIVTSPDGEVDLKKDVLELLACG